jgi:hypothetical protein
MFRGRLPVDVEMVFGVRSKNSGRHKTDQHASSYRERIKGTLSGLLSDVFNHPRKQELNGSY